MPMRPYPRTALRFTFMLLASCWMSTLAPPARTYTLNETGRWTPPYALSGIQVHMALLPGDGQPYHSKVLWWYGRGHHEHTYAGILRWTPGEYTCTSFPGTSLIEPATVPLPQDTAGVFCSSESHLPGGDLFLAGGTQPGTEYGVNHAFTFSAATENWTRVDSMGIGVRRYYPSSCALASGKQLVLSGTRHQQIEFFGGLVGVNTVPTDSALIRYGFGGKGVLDGAVRQSMTPTLWPEPREGHTAVRIGSSLGATHVFGGKSRKGDYLGDFWFQTRADSAFRSDYDYGWQKLTLSPAPSARWEHAAIAVTGDSNAIAIVYGGIGLNAEDSTDIVLDDVWRLWWNPAPGHGYEWQQLDVTTPEALGGRWGHAAVYDEPRKRMLVFGGRDTVAGNPSDDTLWALDFNSSFTSGTWQALDATGPSPRFDHAMDFYVGNPDSAYLFGGNLGGGNLAGDLWRLKIAATPTWEAITDLGGDYPTARSKHSVNVIGHLLFVFGGRSDDSTVHVAHLDSLHEGELRAWTHFVANEAALSGHTASYTNVPSIAERIPQIYDPNATSGSRWTPLTGAPHLQDWYPQIFVWTQDTVFVSGPDLSSYKLALAPTPAWRPYPDSPSGLRGGSAVMYRPGKVMKCGTRDTDPNEAGEDALGVTQSIDLSQQAQGKWRDSDNEMAPRENHNLVLLPNGKVLVVGGTSKVDSPTLPELRPEIWDPDYVNGEKRGRWEGLGILDSNEVTRDYHSTALLLPDARILIGGGNYDSDTNYKIEIFCPPYLFKADGSLATRPASVEVPRVASYGAQFTRCIPAGDTIASVSLLRPAATTHGHDENQRFVPLSFSRTSATNLSLSFPADSAAAPPGEYLLFLVNNKVVPSIGRWVRMVLPGDPTADVAAPDTVGDLTRDMSATNAINLTWTAPGDDNTSGTATRVDLRYSLSPITADNFCQAWIPDSLPPPGAGGSAQHFAVTGLAPCKTYHFAMKYWDEVNNVSVFGDTVAAPTLCGECCSGEVRVHQSREEETAPGGGRIASLTRSAATPAFTRAAAATTTAAGLVVEAVPGPSGLDLRLFPIAEGYEGHAVDTDGGVVVQRPDGSGRWADWLDYDLLPGNRFALCVPERPSRWILLSPTHAAGVIPGVAGAGRAWRLATARHSRHGDVTTALASSDSLPGLEDGDTLVVHYDASPDTGTLARDWLVLFDRSTAEATSTRAGRRSTPDGRVLPAAFALHQNEPNPFGVGTTIRFAIPVASRVRLEVFDLLGRRVRTLADGAFEPGEHSVVWDRRNARGAPAAPGLYFYRMEAGQYREKRAMTIIP